MKTQKENTKATISKLRDDLIAEKDGLQGRKAELQKEIDALSAPGSINEKGRVNL